MFKTKTELRKPINFKMMQPAQYLSGSDMPF